MRYILILCAVTLAVTTAFIWRAVAKPTRYGAFTGAPPAEVAMLIERPTEFAGRTVTIEGDVTAQCKASGCFFSFRSGAQLLRVDLRDIAATAPNYEGRRARVEGQLQGYAGSYQFFANAVEFQ